VVEGVFVAWAGAEGCVKEGGVVGGRA